MSPALQLTLVAVVIFLTHFQQGITGFGCTVLSLPFIALLLGLPTGVPVLVIVGCMVAATIVVESWRRIVWREFAWIAVPVGLTMPIGVWIASALPVNALKLVLAAFTVIIGIEGLIKQFCGAQQVQASPRSRMLASLFLPVGGILHGAFASGGPLVIIYATRAIADKTLFRVTLCLLWTVLNLILIGQRIAQGTMTPEIWKMAAFCAPFALVGIVLGNRAHYRTDPMLFRKIVYSVLIASGLVLAWSGREYIGALLKNLLG